MATTTAQLNGLRALIRDLKYLLAFLSLIALAAVIFLASVSKRVPTDVIIGMMLTLGLLFFGALMGWFVLLRDPRLRFLFPGLLPVESRSAVWVRRVLVFLRLRPARAVAGAPPGDGGLAGAVELVDLRSRGPRVRAPAGSAVALLEEGRAEPEPEPAQQYVSMRLRDMRGQ
ncbi:hypothetical protein D6D24_08381 [Aureobasidium pullulans]|uniref:Uncharacterized protein n=1 Tax=Aureobasidium pullulans TaxID=5580 RepID=A0A4S8VH39_AURPU|nr:hypothetical protein D6D24_08381 [Aureobasidium pullulans]